MRTLRTSYIFALAVIGAEAAAQTTTARPTLTLEGARSVADATAGAAREKKTTGAIAVVDDGGHLLYLLRLDGTFPAASAIATEKARTAAIFRMPTAEFETAVNGGRVAFLGNREATPLEGGVPIVESGQVVGAVGVSGAKSAAQDEELARFGAGALAHPAGR